MSGDWVECRKIGRVWARQMAARFVVATLEGQAIGNAGDYLCRGVAGEEWPIHRQKFESSYIALSPETSRDRLEWQEYRPVGKIVQAREMNEVFRVQSSHGLLKGQAGDYLCQDETGRQWPVQAAIFEQTYELIQVNEIVAHSL